MIRLLQQHVQQLLLQQQHMDYCDDGDDNVLEMLKTVEVIPLSVMVLHDGENDGMALQMVLLDVVVVAVLEDDGASKLDSMPPLVVVLVGVQFETYLERHWDYVPRLIF
jgi:hypothetical protein